MRLVLILVLGLLQGCGFHLRGALELPPEKRVIALLGIPLNHPFAGDLRAILALSQGELVSDPKLAGSVLVVSDLQEDRRVLSLDQNGKAVEFELVLRLRFEARAPDGKVLIPREPMAVHRVYLNPQLDVLGKAVEEGVIWEEMRQEAAQALLRRLRHVLEG
nr:LPS-assembly lipoprotein [uncultured Gammaproteobacteria bacterium]BAL54501.1 LPS-assembly lipoprotein [uncultured Gammaproteobacteria bacterium]